MTHTYIASFHTMLGAVEFHKRLLALGDETACMLPIPRQISVSCGTGVVFSLPFDEEKMANPDLDSIYLCENDSYSKLWSQD